MLKCCACCSVLIALLGVCLKLLIDDVVNFMGLGRLDTMEWNDGSCALLGAQALRGGEDMALWRDGVVIVAAGDLNTTFWHDPALAEGTGVFAVNLRSAGAPPAIRRVELLGYPEGTKFVGHGMFLSNSTNRAYFINHGDYSTAASYVDIFAVEGSDFATLRLRHLSRVGSPLFPAAGINDVVEGRSEREIFVSVWRHFPQTPDVTAFGPTNHQAALLALLGHRYLGVAGRLGVLRCSAAAAAAGQPLAWECGRTAAWGLVSGNGLAVSPDRSMLLVSCPECVRVYRYLIDGASGELSEAGPPIRLPCMADNVEWDAGTGRVLYGGIPVPGRSHQEGHEAPGELVAFPAPTPGSSDSPAAHSLLRHNGSRLSGFSAGVQYGRSLLVGSPFAPGLLHCVLPQQ